MGIKESVNVYIAVPDWEMFGNVGAGHTLWRMTALEQELVTFVFIPIGRHRRTREESHTSLVVEFVAEFGIPTQPALAGLFAHLQIIFVFAVGHADCFANIR